MQRVEQILNYVFKDELISLYEYLGLSAGTELGKEVYRAAKAEGIEIGSKFVMTNKYTGDVRLYPRHFLHKYFKEH